MPQFYKKLRICGPNSIIATHILDIRIWIVQNL